MRAGLAKLNSPTRVDTAPEVEDIADENWRKYQQKTPFAGAHVLRDLLRAEGFAVGRKQVTRLMRRMGITALYCNRTRADERPARRSGRTCCACWRSSVSEPRLGDGHLLHPAGMRPRSPGGRDRLAQPARSDVAPVDFDGYSVLPRGC